MSMDTPSDLSAQPPVGPVVPAAVARAAYFDESVMLADVEWEEYVALRDKPANRGLRMVYAEGVLQIMTLSNFHELVSYLIDHLILEWRVSQQIPAMPSGSMTLRRRAAKRGLEGDLSYYIQCESQVRGLENFDLESAPPPDLVVEVEHSRSASNKMLIYATLAVPEVWRWYEEQLTVHLLVNGEYRISETSNAFPNFPFEQLRLALSQRLKIDETTLITNFRTWLQCKTPVDDR